MRLYYVNRAEGRRFHVRSAIGVDAEVWNDHFRQIQEWRQQLRDRHGIPKEQRLRPSELLSGNFEFGRSRSFCKPDGQEILLEGLLRLEEAARDTGGIEVINVCLYKPKCGAYRRVGIDRMLNRINRSVAMANRHAFLIFPPGEEARVLNTYNRMRVFNLVPSRYERWKAGGPRRNLPVRKVIGGPAFRSACADWLLQLAQFVAHALLLQEEQADDELLPSGRAVGVGDAFGMLDAVLNRDAAARDPQGIVRF